MTANHTHLAAVERPVKIRDVFRLEIGELLPRRTVERLEPEVIGVLVSDRIDHSFAIMGKVDFSPSRNRALQIHKSRVLGRIDGKQRQLHLRSASRSKRFEGYQLAVWRNVQAERGQFGESFRWSAFQRYPVQR